jgi:ribonuclease HI
LNRVEIYTDGACRGNPGAGGWGAVLRYRGRERELHGGEPETTNNRMELTAAIRALEALQRRCKVSLYTDSEVRARSASPPGSRTGSDATGAQPTAKPVKNKDLWQRSRRSRRPTTSNGTGCAAIQATRRTSAPTLSRTAASTSFRKARPGPSWYPSDPVRQIVLDTETTGLEVSEVTASSRSAVSSSGIGVRPDSTGIAT